MTATDAHGGAALTLEELTDQVERGLIDSDLLALTDMEVTDWERFRGFERL